ncbi:MAG: hypothetical protein AAB215_00225 [Planctomycetota bacterium]
MRRLHAILFLLLLVLGTSIGGIAAADDGIDKNTETLWRCAFRGDSLFVRASWVPTVGSSWCVAFMGGNVEDTSAVRPKYLDYWVEDSRGNVWRRDFVSGPDFFCCDGLAAEGVPWLGGVVIKITASGWGCEPAGDCEEMRFVYLAGKDSIASSEWTHVPWNPTAEGLTEAWASAGCIEYPMTVKARLRGATIVFEPTFPPEVKEGDLLEKPLIDELSAYCPRPGGPQEPTAIELFPTRDSDAPERLVIRAEDPIEVLSAVIRAERTGEGKLTSRLFRLGIRAVGRRGFVTAGSLKSVGFLGF